MLPTYFVVNKNYQNRFVSIIQKDKLLSWFWQKNLILFDSLLTIFLSINKENFFLDIMNLKLKLVKTAKLY